MKKQLQRYFVCLLTLIGGATFAQGFVQVTLNNANEAISLKQDQVLEIRLPYTPSSGYAWYLKESRNIKFLQQVESSFESDTPDNLEGSTGNQIIRYIPTGNGTEAIEMEYKRLWESDDQVVSTYKLAINCEGIYTGSYVPAKIEEPVLEAYKPSKSLGLPSAFSWLPQMTSVKNQGSCGSCWSFASSGVFEAVINIWDHNVRDLSEQWLVDCDNSSNGCSGGSYAYKMFVSKGSVYETDIPYKAKDGTCVSSATYHEKAKNYGTVTNNVDKMKQALYDYGPMYVSICSGNNLSSYKSGIISKTDGTQTNHGVVLTGWDDANGCWIIKNSWGASFGEKGYFRIKYGLSAVGTKVAYVDYKGIIPHTVTGIFNNENSNVVIYPNPSNEGQFTFSGLENSTKIEVVDILGKLVHEQTTQESTYKMDISNLHKGIYFYRVTNMQTNQVLQGKLVFN